MTWLVAKGFKVVTAFKPGEPCTFEKFIKSFASLTLAGIDCKTAASIFWY